MNLIPSLPGLTPNYWCTWCAQGAFRTQAALENPTDLKFQGDQGAKYVRESLREEVLFGPTGWLNTFYPKARADLYAVLDDGWDVDFGVHPDTQRWKFGACELSAQRFPSFPGEPRAGLKALNDAVNQAGWRGVGLWIAAQCVGDGKDGFELPQPEVERYWRERARWCHHAGIEYWKVDWGYRCGCPDFRQMLTEIAKQEAPGLFVEHTSCMAPVNGAPESAGRFATDASSLEMATRLAGASDVFRTYDTLDPLGTPATLDRAYELLKGAKLEPGRLGLLNTEGEIYLGAALGCAFGALRFPPIGPGAEAREVKLDEALRAVRWQRVAPAFGIGQGEVLASEAILSDDHYFVKGETWYPPANAQTVRQSAPAIVARGMSLPIVKSDAEAPYVVASRHPNGAISVATLPRHNTTKGNFQPPADVTIEVGNGEAPVGVFGTFHSLALKLTAPLDNRKVFAQDMAGEVASDITQFIVSTSPTGFTLEGQLIDRIGLQAATPNDSSGPGMILSIQKPI